jgi:hypothetical protein
MVDSGLKSHQAIESIAIIPMIVPCSVAVAVVLSLLRFNVGSGILNCRIVNLVIMERNNGRSGR